MKKNNIFVSLCCTFTLFAQHPTFIDLYNKGVSLHKTNPLEAIELFEQSLIYEPESIEAHYNAGYLLREKGAFAQALPHYEHILSKQPQHAAAHLGRAIINLAFGNYEAGWPEFEWHLGSESSDDVQTLKKMIAHNISLKNKIILLRAEWGAGDTIQMIRYAQLLHERGAFVVVHLLHESLVPLFKQQKYLDQVVPPSECPPPFHFQIPMMNLPSVFCTTVNTVPSKTPYLIIENVRAKQWQSHLAQDRNYKIGLCWKGNYIHGPEKFIPLSYLAQLANIPSVSLYSLQRIHGLDQLELLENQQTIHTFDETFDAIPFLDTASVMQNLDLIITVDTSIAHLAGALNVPVWVILPQKADWRWMLERNDTVWYPSMKLFRQKKYGQWDDVFEAVKKALGTISSPGVALAKSYEV